MELCELWREFLLQYFQCPNSCGVPLKSINWADDKHFMTVVYCPRCKKGKSHSNDPETREALGLNKKKEAAMCANT